MKPFYPTLFLVMLVDIVGIIAQTDMRFEYLSELDGLSNNRILSIHEDKEGFIWFGTWEGLNKYDGYDFTVYQPDPNNALQTLSHNIISDIVEDKEGLLWLATRGGGLNHIDKRSGIVTTYLLDSTGAHYWNALVDIFEDKKGDLWISGAGGLARFDVNSRNFTRFPSPEAESMIVSVVEDQNGRLYAASPKKLYHFNPQTGEFIPFTIDFSLGYQFTALHMDKEEILWVTTNGKGLFFLDPHHPSPKLIPYNPEGQINKIITSTLGEVYEDPSGIIWLATTGGLQRVDKKTDQVMTFRTDPLFSGSLSNNTVESVLVDRNGHLWVGTTNGINKWTANTKSFQSYRIKPSSQLFHLDENNITHLVEDDLGIIWLGNSGKTKDSKVPGGGLFKFNPKRNEIVQVDLNLQGSLGKSKNQFFVPYQDVFGNMWVGTDEALLCLDKESGKFNQYPTAVRVQALAEDPSGKLWFGGSKGGYIFQGALVCFDPKTNNFTYYWYDPQDKEGLNYHNISSITVSRTGDIWVATPGGGINRLTPKSGKFTYYKPQIPLTLSNINDKDIRSIYEDAHGYIWVGTNQGGLLRFDPEEKKFVTFTVNQGLPSNHIESMVEDHRGNLWIGTSKGLSRFDPDTQEFRNYSTMDGLPGNIFNQGSKSSLDQKLYFGTTNGFVAFHPDSIKDNPIIPPVYITGLKILDKETPLPAGIIELPYDENFLIINFVAIDYTAPEKNQYAYQLEGVDKNWVYAGIQRSANYTDLKPGKYTFRVKGSNNDGVWNEKGATASIRILPPWWLSKGAYSGYAILVILGVMLAQRETVRRERFKAGLRLKQVEADKLRDIDSLKSRFFSNISHEFRTPLSLIQGTVEKLSRQEQSLSELLPSYKIIHRNADRLLQLVNQLLDLSRLEAGKLSLQTHPGEVVGFLTLLSSSFSSLFENKGINYRNKLPHKPLWVLFDADKLEKILCNLLSNAYKFTPKGGEVWLEIQIDRTGNAEALLHLSVRDTGIGIPEELVSRIFDRFFQSDLSETRTHEGAGIGLALTKELVELHKGTILVDSKFGKGTDFRATLLLQVIEEPLANTPEDPVLPREVLWEEKEIFFPEKTLLSYQKHQPKKDRTKVLVVEDNADLRHFIKEILPKEYDVFDAEDGNMAWISALELGPDLIISDVMMPGMDGVSLCRRVKGDERTSHIAVILLTAKADTESKLKGLETGADDYLTKPFRLDELQLRVHNQLLQRKRLQQRFSRSLTFEPQEVIVNSMDERFLQKVMKVLDEFIANPSFNLEIFSSEIGLSRVHLHRKLKSLTDQSPGGYDSYPPSQKSRQLAGATGGKYQ